MMMSMLALFTQEAMAIFELYYVPMLFLSGQLFPISVLPPWAMFLGKLFPFYYTTGAPTEILIGRVKGNEALQTIGMQLLWIAIAYLVSRILWAKGLKHYTGVGM
jgi:ABC-2 type transport system permease protein